MILIDTSVWIEFFKQRDPVVNGIRPLLSEQKVLTLEPVFSELLYGVRNKKEREIIQSYWQVLPRIEFGRNSMLEAATFANKNDYQRKGIGLMDAIIIKFALDGKHLIWTLDSRINAHVDARLLFSLS